jgi:hypothetical protein
MHGIHGVGNYQYLLQLRQSQSPKSDANSSALRAANQRQPQNTKQTTQGRPPAFLRSLFRDDGENNSTSATRTTGSSTSQRTTVDEDPHDPNASGDGSAGRDGVKSTLSGHRQHTHGDTQASARAASSVENRSLAGSDASGGGSSPQSGTTGSRGDPTASRTTGITSYRQQVINKYMQLSPASDGVAGPGNVLVTA